jgi:Holliday junction resolvase RusA-like endonuclease
MAGGDPMSAVQFLIPGTPVQQGSKTAFVVGKRAVVTDQNKATLKPWRATVAAAASQHAVGFDVPVTVVLRFVMPRPKKPRFDVPAVKPDIDKLTRAVLDGLTDGGVLKDDSRVVGLFVTESYAGNDDARGVHVTVVEYREVLLESLHALLGITPPPAPRDPVVIEEPLDLGDWEANA